MHHVAITQHTSHQLAEIIDESADRQDTSMLKWLLDQSDAQKTFGAVQFVANKGAKVMSIAADETQYNAIEAAKNYPQIQQWLRDFYQDANSAVDA
ncbi:hypothetical protein OEA41_008436 [Lepraria neglecta]|uniref:Uncharacterized protein n=1 Tax=Lepraria neglecta TaxID=209136 RepID=A0AAD9ZEL9_9LECA|nr:hypothetical protein OEA41_008436 [Lepraria neglecta]